MLRADTGNYNRFLTSLGLAMWGAALVIPYFFFRDTETLEVTTAKLRKLTPTGREALEGRQDALVTLEPVVIGTVVLLVLAGAALLFVGGRRLRSAQESEEEENELRKSRTRAEIRQMSPEQLADKQDQEAREAAEEAPKPPPGKRVNLADVRYRELRDAIERVEDRIAKELGSSEFETHDFLPNVRITSSKFTGSLEIDGLFEAKDQSAHKDIVLGVKVVAPRRGIAGLADQLVNELLATVAKYEAIFEQPALGWLVVVIPEMKQRLESLEEIRRRLRDAAAPAGAVTVVREDELPTLAPQFRELVRSRAALED
jgi:hypothetical protein